MKLSQTLTVFMIALNMVAYSKLSAAGTPSQLRGTMRTIESLQDDTVVGNNEAFRLMSRLMLQMETDIANSVESDLRNPQNIRAIAVYLMSGGNPNVVEKAYKNVRIEPGLDGLFQGSIAFAQGNKEKAATLLEVIPANGLPSSIAGRLALIQGILVAENDPKKAIQRFQLASALMPGTIVDEGAQRRCSYFASKSNDLETFKSCSSKVIRTYSDSIYWKDFLVSFTQFVATIPDKESSFYSNWLLPTLNERPVALEIEVMLQISTVAARNGNFKLAVLCGSRVSQIADAGSSETNRALLYSGSAMIGVKMPYAGAIRLKSVDVSKLGKEDKDLLGKAMDMLKQIGIEDRNNIAAGQNEGLVDAEVARAAFDGVVARATQALANISTDSRVAGP